MGLIRVMLISLILLVILGGTLYITRWIVERFIDFFSRRKDTK